MPADAAAAGAGGNATAAPAVPGAPTPTDAAKQMEQNGALLSQLQGHALMLAQQEAVLAQTVQVMSASSAKGSGKQVGQSYKTRICKEFFSGSCKRGDNCQFAHGEHEMRSVADNVRHNTQVSQAEFHMRGGKGGQEGAAEAAQALEAVR